MNLGLVDAAGVARTAKGTVSAAGRALVRDSGPKQRLSRRQWTFDALLMLVMTAYTLWTTSRWLNAPPQQLRDEYEQFAGSILGQLRTLHPQPSLPSSVVLAAGALASVPLLLRRRLPLTVFWITILASVLHHVHRGLDPSVPIASCLIAAYSSLMYSRYRVAAVLSLLPAAAMLGGLTTIPAIPAVVVPFLVLGAVGLGVNSVHIWRQRVESGRERIRALEAEQQTATRLAVERERARIARELHDVVTHNVSVMVIQAGAARKIMDAEPEQARQALLAVESGGRAAMAELRHVMGLLTSTAEEPGSGHTVSTLSASTLIPLDAAERPARDGSPAAAGTTCPESGLELAPQPGLGQVAALAGRIRDAGVPVELTVSGTPSPLPAGVDLAAYRVVQEALTNAVKHAAGASVQVIVDYAPETVRVEVADSGGRPGAPAGPGNGRGLIGLRERLAMYGGTLQAGRRPTGGFRVRAVIPLEQP
ncbi:MAG TPA: histidine kinase [Actinocrinis sp.]